jgi:DNA replication and repair protein RecF
MFVTHLQLQNFRCFPSLSLNFDKSLVLIEGANGLGKTSLLEALYTACYKRSFRTAFIRELIKYQMPESNHDQAFHIKVLGKSDDTSWKLSLGYSAQQTLWRLNEEDISFMQVSSLYSPLAITEDDMMLITGAPAVRRSFLDQTLCLRSPAYIKAIRYYKKILEARNALLENSTLDYSLYQAWSSQFWEYALGIEKERRMLLAALENRINILSKDFIEAPFYLSYEAALSTQAHNSFEEFIEKNPFLYEREKRARRSLWGPHLDEINIILDHKKVKSFASRGMHKLLVILLKMAQVFMLEKKAVFLIDDFFLDLDASRLNKLIRLLYDLNLQIFITCPFNFHLSGLLLPSSYQHILLSI